MKTFGNGQTNGKPITLGTTPTLLHTAPAGSATPHLVTVHAFRKTPASASTYAAAGIVHVGVYDSAGALVMQFDRKVDAEGGVLTVNAVPVALNGSCTVKAWADDASVAVIANVDDQSSVAGTAVQSIGSGLVAAVQNASRHAVGAQGGTGQATEANANIKIARAGILRNMRVVSDATVGGGATITVTLRKNGADTSLTQTVAAADTTVEKTDTDAVAVAAGDLICFKVACDNAGAPAANIQAAVEYVAS